MRWAPCTMRSQIASAMVGSPITSCQDDTGSCDTIRVEARAWRSSRISSSASRARASSGSSAKSSIYSDVGVNRFELNRFAVGVASAVLNLEALPKHNPYMMSGLY